jgi:hypothetical protein
MTLLKSHGTDNQFALDHSDQIVAVGSKAVFPALKCDFRFTPGSGLRSDITALPKRADIVL